MSKQSLLRFSFVICLSILYSCGSINSKGEDAWNRFSDQEKIDFVYELKDSLWGVTANKIISWDKESAENIKWIDNRALPPGEILAFLPIDVEEAVIDDAIKAKAEAEQKAIDAQKAKEEAKLKAEAEAKAKAEAEKLAPPPKKPKIKMGLFFGGGKKKNNKDEKKEEVVVEEKKEEEDSLDLTIEEEPKKDADLVIQENKPKRRPRAEIKIPEHVRNVGLYLGTTEGLYFALAAKGEWIKLESIAIRALAMHPKAGIVWAGDGFVGRAKEIKSIHLKGKVNSHYVAVTEDGNIWANDLNKGVVNWTINSKIYRYDSSNGLCGNHVIGLTAHPKGEVFVICIEQGTKASLWKDNRFFSYEAQQPLPSNRIVAQEKGWIFYAQGKWWSLVQDIPKIVLGDTQNNPLIFNPIKQSFKAEDQKVDDGLVVEDVNVKADASKADASKADASKADASKTDTSKTDASKTDAQNENKMTKKTDPIVLAPKPQGQQDHPPLYQMGLDFTDSLMSELSTWTGKDKEFLWAVPYRGLVKVKKDGTRKRYLSETFAFAESQKSMVIDKVGRAWVVQPKGISIGGGKAWEFHETTDEPGETLLGIAQCEKHMILVSLLGKARDPKNPLTLKLKKATTIESSDLNPDLPIKLKFGEISKIDWTDQGFRDGLPIISEVMCTKSENLYASLFWTQGRTVVGIGALHITADHKKAQVWEGRQGVDGEEQSEIPVLPEGTINGMASDENETIYLATNAGLAIVKAPVNQKREIIIFDEASMPTEIINDVALDEKTGKIWLATDRGLGYIEGVKFTLQILSKKSASAVFFDHENQLWAAFQDIIQIGRDDRFKSFTIPPTVKVGTIQHIEALKNGNIWFATTQGLYFYNAN